MQILKKNGKLQAYDPNKILKRIKLQATDLNVDWTKICIETQNVLFDGISSVQIDTEAARIAASYITTHNDYNTLAANILVSRLHKEFKGTDYFERTKGLLDPIVKQKYDDWGITLDEKHYNTDYSFDYFGINAFLNVYSLKNKKQASDDVVKFVLVYIDEVTVFFINPRISINHYIR